jgi:hypothetical protein
MCRACWNSEFRPATLSHMHIRLTAHRICQHGGLHSNTTTSRVKPLSSSASRICVIIWLLCRSIESSVVSIHCSSAGCSTLISFIPLPGKLFVHRDLRHGNRFAALLLCDLVNDIIDSFSFLVVCLNRASTPGAFSRFSLCRNSNFVLRSYATATSRGFSAANGIGLFSVSSVGSVSSLSDWNQSARP